MIRYENAHYGYNLFWNNHHYFLESTRKRMTPKLASIFALEVILRENKLDRWVETNSATRAVFIKKVTDYITPCSFKIGHYDSGVTFLQYTLLKHPRSLTEEIGCGAIPEKDWEQDITIFFEEDVEDYI